MKIVHELKEEDKKFLYELVQLLTKAKISVIIKLEKDSNERQG